MIKTGLTTRQLVQQYLAFGPINLKHVRLLKQMAGIRSTLLPISFGQVQFLPTGGASHGQTDWIGTFHLQHYLESGKKLQVRWGDYLGAELNFRGSFRQGLHDAGMIGELFVKIVHEIAAWGGLETIEVPQCQEFLDCACAFHQQLRLNQTGYFQQFEEQHSRIFSKYLLDETERATPELFEATVNYGLRQIARLENYN
ncbi:hypothetical protein ACNAN0_01300 [Agrilactobacillus fermenti]|uniref:hypothetical protein n=1 Tax=Agrilactobacillus fermenti TaxID=2586909 RepID=UPI003A5BA74E